MDILDGKIFKLYLHPVQTRTGKEILKRKCIHACTQSCTSHLNL